MNSCSPSSFHILNEFIYRSCRSLWRLRVGGRTDEKLRATDEDRSSTLGRAAPLLPKKRHEGRHRRQRPVLDRRRHRRRRGRGGADGGAPDSGASDTDGRGGGGGVVVVVLSLLAGRDEIRRVTAVGGCDKRGGGGEGWGSNAEAEMVCGVSSNLLC